MRHPNAWPIVQQSRFVEAELARVLKAAGARPSRRERRQMQALRHELALLDLAVRGHTECPHCGGSLGSV